MTRLSVVAVSIFVLAAIPTIASATHSPGKGPKRDLVVGSARFPVVAAHVRINAKSGPSGQNPRGHFFLRQGSFQFRGSVTCVLVVGNRASVGGRVTRSSGAGAPPVGSGFVELIEDNGEPGRNDRSQTLFVASPPTTCPAPTTPFFVVARGNYVVHDGT
jgi:hypothetical protein